ncbi:MAG: lipoate--protein ligase family protein [Gemmatimonadota bacterium]|nr:lipoate--protein ligase family protein [Gemmatimonadota bacterium]MDQ8150166.1 lipoate--protein ligase family protein [Gemmatimonadota bacterium]MDQ8170477.1 lipoate--protein ligase family protein [Gemmatimonadota bacterium]MDQ8177706.1 lipoate--protein ligase family protein [Gemmatimonadota bacterium]
MSASPCAAFLDLPWSLLDSGPAAGVENMSTDLALLAHTRSTGRAVLRIYAWSRPTLSLGRNERARGSIHAPALRAEGIEVVRRPTGGRALLHDHEITYSIAAPVGTMTLRESYVAINALLLDALARLGVAATAIARDPAERRALRPDGAACFAEPGEGEIVVGGAKLVGSAQWREEGALLQHGSILLGDDQPRIARLRPPGTPEHPIAPAATLTGALGRPVTYAEVRDALVAALTDAIGAVPSPLDPTSLRPSLARLLISTADPNWTWRR